MRFSHLVLLVAATSVAAETAPVAKPDKSQFSIFHPTPEDQRRPYNTDRSSKTDSPYSIDAGVFQIETDAFSWTVDRNNPSDLKVRIRRLLAGQTNLRIGLTNWMDLQLFPQGYVERRTSGADFGEPLTQRGFGDTTVRLKINFVGNDGGNFALGLVSALKLPTNGDHLANSVYEPGFGLPINMALPAGFTFFGQARIDILDAVGSSDRHLWWSSPVGVSRTIAGKLSGYAEFYNAVSSSGHDPWIGTIDLGLTYQVTPNFSIDLNAYIGVTESADDLNIFTGFACRF